MLIYERSIVMKTRKKYYTVIAVLLIIIFLGLAIFVTATNFFVWFHKEMISCKPNPETWTLSNDSYTVIPQIDDSVTFEVENKNGEVVYSCKEAWRSRDFKSITIDENNDIKVVSGDTGEVVYEYTDSTWKINNTVLC